MMRHALAFTIAGPVHVRSRSVATSKRSTALTMSGAAGILSFLRVVGALKRTKRAGWVLCGVPEPESVAEHMYRMGMISMVVADTARSARVTKMALVHDLAEAVVGDITPHDGVSDEDKQTRERRALREIISTIDARVAKEIEELWEEYEAGETDDARLVKDIDKFEMILQAEEYEVKSDVDLQQFFDSTRDRFKTPHIRALVDELRAQRALRLQNKVVGAGTTSPDDK